MSVNAVIVPLIDTLAVLANGYDDLTGAAAAVPATDGTLKRIESNFATTLFATLPIVTGELGCGAFKRGVGRGSERTRSGKRAKLSIKRYNNAAADTYTTAVGSFAVYGVDLPDPQSCKPLGNAFATAQSETVQVFASGVEVAVNSSTTFDASALGTAAINADSKGYNWLVVVNGQVIPWSAAALANNLSWSITAGVVTVRAGSSATVLPAASDVVVYKLATADVTELLAAGIHAVEEVSIQSKTVVWTYWTTNQLATTRTLATLQHVVD